MRGPGACPGEIDLTVPSSRIELLVDGSNLECYAKSGGDTMPKSKLKVSMHCGRSGSGKHNDRSFLSGLSDEKKQQIAPHIDATKSDDNYYYAIGVEHDASNFTEVELQYYRDNYGAAIEATNRRYRSEGHPERCKSVEDVYHGARTRPEEVILQIGKMGNTVSPKLLATCTEELFTKLDTWSVAHGNHMHILSMVLHLDESTPHIHLRRVWDYTDKDGNLRIGQNKALELSGISLPDPTKPEGRYNNRKMTFDSLSRGLWQEICKSKGLELDTIPRPGMKHKSKADYIYSQLTAEIEEATQNRDQAQLEALAASKQAVLAKEKNSALVAQNGAEQAKLASLWKDLKETQKSLTEASECLQQAERELKRTRTLKNEENDKYISLRDRNELLAAENKRLNDNLTQARRVCHEYEGDGRVHLHPDITVKEKRGKILYIMPKELWEASQKAGTQRYINCEQLDRQEIMVKKFLSSDFMDNHEQLQRDLSNEKSENQRLRSQISQINTRNYNLQKELNSVLSMLPEERRLEYDRQKKKEQEKFQEFYSHEDDWDLGR